MDKEKIQSTLLSLSIIGLSEAAWYFLSVKADGSGTYSPMLGGICGLPVLCILALFVHIPIEIIEKKRGKRKHMTRMERRHRILFIALILAGIGMIASGVNFYLTLSKLS